MLLGVLSVLTDCPLAHMPTDADNGQAFRSEAKRRVLEVIDPAHYSSHTSTETTTTTPHPSPAADTAPCDTIVYPLVQMGPLGIRTDSAVTEEFMRWVPSGSVVHLASGYFNLTQHYREVLVGYSKAAYDILTAAPQVRL